MSKSTVTKGRGKFEVSIGTNENGSGAHIAERKPRGYADTLNGSIMDMAELLFDLKEALSTHPLGRGCVDKVAAQRSGVIRTKVRN